MALSAAGLYTRARTMLPEVLKFGIVGGIGSVVDLGGTAVLHSEYHVGPLVSKAVAVTLATVVTYLGSRFWTFKERENQSARREAVLFIVLNVVGLLIAEAVIGFVTYVLGLHGKIEFNAASVLGTGLGTIFRFYAYRKWVFLAPPSAVPAGLSNAPAFPDYPPWEFDPAFLPPERPASLVSAPVAAAAPAWNEPAWNEPAPARAWNTPARAAAWHEEPVSAAWSPAPSAWDAAPARGWESAEHSQRRTDNAIIPNGRVASPHRTQLPGAGQDVRRQGSTGPMAAGPVAPPTAPRPSAGRHRKP
ncbi:MAG TPA: GtrA family protein [Trebonia sp.]|nr:GtrA family protein [Trebonia sp.]